MANTVYTTEEIELSDGTPVTLKPLVIKGQRKFSHEWSQMQDTTTEDEAFDVYVRCAGISLSKQLKTKVENQYDGEYQLTDEYREYLEDNLELDTIFKVLEVCGGLRLNDPKLLEALANTQDQDGQTSTL